MALDTRWKTDNYKFVGKAFDFTYANRLNKLLSIMSEANAKSIDYELTGTGGFGEMERYDGTNLNQVKEKRGFKTIIVPEEYTSSVQIHRKAALIDKSGETKKTGTKLGTNAAMTVYVHALRMFSRAFDGAYLGGDGKAWAATDHPVASKYSEGRKYIPDPDAGTYSNLIRTQLTTAAITQAQSQAQRFITPDGLPFLCEMDCLLVSPELEATAKKLLGDNAKLYPDDSTNAANPVADMTYMVIGGGKDGFSAKQWAICDRQLMKEMVKIVYNTRPDIIQSMLENPLIDMYTAYADFGTGWGDARQIIFSDPA